MALEKKSGVGTYFMELVTRLTMERWQGRLDEMEKEMIRNYGEGSVLPVDISPARLNPVANFRDFVGWKPFLKDIKESNEIVPLFIGVIGSAKESVKITEKNHAITPAKSPPDAAFWEEFEKLAESLGVGLVGYTNAPAEIVFKEMGVLYPNAIALGMEMDEAAIAESPRYVSGKEAIRVYRDLGRATNKLAEFMHARGYKAQPVHPYGGMILFPLVATAAGLGTPGLQGLLLSRKYGSRQRLSIISTDANPLPPPHKNPMAKIREFCETCKQCIKACPGQAFYDPPVEKDEGVIVTHIDHKKCYPYFAKFTGCSVCLKVCNPMLEKAGLIQRDYKYTPE